MEIAPDANEAGGKLAENIVHFARALRRAGLPVGPAAVIDAIRAVEVAGLSARTDFYWTLHAIFVSKREQRALFDEAFRLFWRSRELVRKLGPASAPSIDPVEPDEAERPGAARAAEAMLGDMPDISEDSERVATEARLVVSDRELLQRRDFAQMTTAEIAEAERRIDALRLSDDRVLTRRSMASSAPGAIDPRRTLRASLRTGGRMILLRHRCRREVQPPIVILADISGSMGEYTRVFLHFMHVLTEKRGRVHSFLFGTRLTNVTRQMRLKDPDAALAACSEAVPDWSGGTRIAPAIRTFNRLWSRRVLGQGAIVLLFTDGLERDAEADLGKEMDRLHRSCRRLIWLNPLLRYGGFEARAMGIRAMLPYVDEFRPVHSLEAIADLCAALARGDRAGVDPRRWMEAA